MPFVGEEIPKPLNEDGTFREELHKRGNHAQEQAAYHASQLRVWQRIMGACESALNVLEDQPEQPTEYAMDYDIGANEDTAPSRFR